MKVVLGSTMFGAGVVNLAFTVFNKDEKTWLTVTSCSSGNAAGNVVSWRSESRESVDSMMHYRSRGSMSMHGTSYGLCDDAS